MYEKFDKTNLGVPFNMFTKLHHVSSRVTVNVIYVYEKGPRIHYFSGMDTYSDFLRLKIHHTLAPLFRYNKCF